MTRRAILEAIGSAILGALVVAACYAALMAGRTAL